MKLPAELRTPLRAATAAAIAILIGRIFALPRYYWALLVAVVLVGGTLGDNIGKSLTRLGMTALGCAAAFLLSRLLGQSRVADITVMLVCVFFALYFRGTAYAWMVFSVTMYVIFLFTLLAGPAQLGPLIMLRVYLTAIGCGVALASSLIIPAARAGSAFSSELAAFFTTARSHCAAAVDDPAPAPRDPLPAPAAGAPALLQKMSALHKLKDAARWEGPWLRRSLEQRERLLRSSMLLGHYALGFAEARRSLAASRAEQALSAELGMLQDELLARFDALLAPRSEWARAHGAAQDALPLQDRLFSRAVELHAQGVLDDKDLLPIGPVLYFSEQLHRILSQLVEEST
jgi:uncharacterized membrane protein YccC